MVEKKQFKFTEGSIVSVKIEPFEKSVMICAC